MWFKFVQAPTVGSVLSLLVVSPAFAGSGNGGGIAGPDLGGSSIPVSVDRLYTESDIGSAAQTCMKPVLISLFEQIFRQTPDLEKDWTLELNSSTSLSVEGVDGTWRTTIAAHFTYRHLAGCGFSFFQWDQYCGYNGGSCLRFGFDDQTCPLKIPGTKVLRDFDLKTSNDTYANPVADLPRIYFEYVLANPKYDELGNVVDSTRVAKNVRIEAPLSVAQPVPFYNGNTGKKTHVSVNSEALVKCMKAELQKAGKPLTL